MLSTLLALCTKTLATSLVLSPDPLPLLIFKVIPRFPNFNLFI